MLSCLPLWQGLRMRRLTVIVILFCIDCSSLLSLIRITGRYLMTSYGRQLTRQPWHQMRVLPQKNSIAGCLLGTIPRTSEFHTGWHLILLHQSAQLIQGQLVLCLHIFHLTDAPIMFVFSIYIWLDILLKVENYI